MDDQGGASMANKRPCISCPAKQPPLHSSSLFSALTTTDPPPYHLPPELNNVDSLLHNLLMLPIFDSSSSFSSVSVNVSFEKLLSYKSSDSEQNLLINRALLFGSAIVDAAKSHERKMDSKHNSHVWVLPHELTIKVFSMLDTSSLCCAAATCTMFCRCAMDPMCYVDIDLRTYVPKVNNAVLSTMIQRAGKVLQSMKVGIVDRPNSSSVQPLTYSLENSIDTSGCKWYEKRSRQGKDSAILTRSCLNCLTTDNGAAGSILKKLHLYNIDKMNSSSLCHALSACPSLLDFKVVGRYVELRPILESLSFNCHALERLFVESLTRGTPARLKLQTCIDFVKNCPHLTSVALRGHQLHDNKAQMLIQGFHKLKHVDFTMCYSLSGSFLRNLGNSEIEVLLIRDCMNLKETEVRDFLLSLIRGEFKSLNHIDLSNKEGFVCGADSRESCIRSRYGKEWSLARYFNWLSKERPNLSLLAELPKECEHITDVADFWSSQLSSTSSDSSFSESEPSDVYVSSDDHSSNPDEAAHDSDSVIFVDSEEDV